MEILVELKDKATASLKKVNNSFKDTAGNITKSVAKLGVAFAALAGAAAIGGMVIALKKSISAFIEFEDAMASVAKTTGLSGDALAGLSSEIKTLSTNIPIAAVELADIAAIAGQLGIQGTENIISFTETVAQISVAFDMSAESAATAMAKLGKIYDIPIEQTSNFASAINILGNTTAASETQIAAFGMSLGAAAVNMGFSATESMSLGATLISMGMDASDAGTRLNSAFTKMAANIDKVSEFLGISEDAFRSAFGEDPMAMIIKIVEKLSTIEDPLERATAASEMFGIVGAKSITGLGGDLEGLLINLEGSAKGFEENTSLADEFAAKTNTLKAAIQLLKNNFNAVAITIGEKFAPHIKAVSDTISEMLPNIDSFAATLSGDFINGIISSASALIDKLQPGLDAFKSSAESITTIISDLSTEFGNNETAMTSLSSVLDVTIGVFNTLAEAVSAVLGFFAEHPTATKFAIAIAAAIALIMSPILAVVAVMGVLAVAWDQNWYGIKDTTLKIVDIIVDIISAGLDSIEKFWNAHGDTIMMIVDVVWETIKTTVDIIMNNIMVTINVILALIEGDWKGAWETIKEHLGTTFDKMKGMTETWTELIKTLFSLLWEAIKQGVADWAENTKTQISNWIESTKQGFADWVSDILQKIDDWSGGILSIIVYWSIDALGIILKWVLNTYSTITGWVEDVKSAFTSFTSSVLSTLQSWYNSIVKLFDFSSITVKWPSLTMPKIVIPSHSLHDKSSPHSQYDVWSQHDQAGHTKWEQISMAKGGPVTEDSDARIHEGEYVVPKAGALVMEGGGKPAHMQMTYNIGTVLGVDHLESLLDKHDRELYRRLVSLV